MNFVYLSPHFPPNYFPFTAQLRRYGVNVLGVADVNREDLHPEVKNNLADYYRLHDLHDYDDLVRALGYFTHQHGKLHRVESHNEYWLETEARLRTDFNLEGPKSADISRIKQKSAMKRVYQKAGIRVARGRVVRSLSAARKLIEETGYPVVAKPDVGVGAAATYKIRDEKELKAFFAAPPPVDYIFEAFIQGVIHSFDGLADQDGNPVFTTSHVFSQGIMETVNEDQNIFYYSQRKLAPDLEEAGLKTLRAFDVRARFFHFEFFRTPEGELVAIEVNIRPPGGLTMDMFNYANDIDLYGEYANVIANNRFDAVVTRPYHCCYIGRKHGFHYHLSHDQVLSRFSGLIVHHEPISPVLRGALGDHGYLARSPDLEQILAAVEAIHATD